MLSGALKNHLRFDISSAHPVDPAKLVTHDITLAEVATAVQNENVFLATGQLDGEIEAHLYFR